MFPGRHLGRTQELYGKGEQDMITVDMCLDTVEAMWVKYVPLIYWEKLVSLVQPLVGIWADWVLLCALKEGDRLFQGTWTDKRLQPCT
eukprot:1161269-Pelagomonas_calceolata.AAC.18